MLLPLVAAVVPCIPSGNEVPINKALQQREQLSSSELTVAGGRGAVVELCPGSVHRLQEPIRFTAPRQTLTTSLVNGEEVEAHSRAMIIVEGEEQATAIK